MAGVETATNLIEASKVQGTAVYNPHGERLGTIDDVMIEKRSGQAAYAIMSFGGFLGVGGEFRPIPWSKLKYDREIGGYVVDIEPRVLEGAPAFAAGAEPRWGDRAYEENLHTYYGARPYWGEAWM